MPKRTDIKSILVIGSGPIIIGQACEFDYAGVQACIALREEGYKVILINSNPATIMTDPEFSDLTYIEPLTTEFVSFIIEKDRPDAILTTVGGQTSLNLVCALEEKGILKKYGVKLIGANIQSIQTAEDRELLSKAITKVGLNLAKSRTARNLKDALKTSEELGFPLLLRLSYSLGGSNSSVVEDEQSLINTCEKIFTEFPDQKIILDEYLYGWKEFEMEVIRDKNDNCIIICGIENLDPLGVHTGDSITVSPPMTLTDKEYQKMRDASFAVMRAIGVETGGANVQFGIDPQSGRMVVIEANPRVSRSSALASKATGYPIAKIAAKLAVGYSLDELICEINGIPASFEPTIDYVVVKIPHFQFDKFPNKRDELGSQMFSIGEVMAIGRNFKEALLKAIRSIERKQTDNLTSDSLLSPNSRRIWAIFAHFREGKSIQEIFDHTKIDKWFLDEIKQLVDAEKLNILTPHKLLELKKNGFSDIKIANILNVREEEVLNYRNMWNIFPAFKLIDGCCGEFEPKGFYSYSTYGEFCEFERLEGSSFVIIGSGANRIGQGIEFDYSCVRAIKALQTLGYKVILINCNPETVSTDCSVADKLYCSPLTYEDVYPIIKKEQPLGVFIQYGGQTSLLLANSLEKNNIPLVGLDFSSINICEDRELFREFIEKLALKMPTGITIKTPNDKKIFEIPFPVIVRPSYVISGEKMIIVSNLHELEKHLDHFSQDESFYPIVVESFLENAIEVEVDAISDGTEVFVPAIIEQIEKAGIHSGDSVSVTPPFSLSKELQESILNQTRLMAIELNIRGFMNVQYAISGKNIYVLEVNPRASRTVPFLSKSLGVDLVAIATQCALGKKIQKKELKKRLPKNTVFVKYPVFPSSRFGEIHLGPEMKSTGEVMGIGSSLEEAYKKAEIASGFSTSIVNEITVRSLQEIKNN